MQRPHCSPSSATLAGPKTPRSAAAAQLTTVEGPPHPLPSPVHPPPPTHQGLLARCPGGHGRRWNRASATPAYPAVARPSKARAILVTLNAARIARRARGTRGRPKSSSSGAACAADRGRRHGGMAVERLRLRGGCNAGRAPPGRRGRPATALKQAARRAPSAPHPAPACMLVARALRAGRCRMRALSGAASQAAAGPRSVRGGTPHRCWPSAERAPAACGANAATTPGCRAFRPFIAVARAAAADELEAPADSSVSPAARDTPGAPGPAAAVADAPANFDALGLDDRVTVRPVGLEGGWLADGGRQPKPPHWLAGTGKSAAWPVTAPMPAPLTPTEPSHPSHAPPSFLRVGCT